VAVNKCYGGFGLSAKAIFRYWELKGRSCYFYTVNYCDVLKPLFTLATDKDLADGWCLSAYDLATVEEVEALTNENYHKHYLYLDRDEDEWRADPHLIRVIEELGAEANGSCANLQIVEVPINVKWTINEYDGMEWVAEVHRTW